MKKVFFSVPMNGRTDENIKKSIEKMADITRAMLGEEIEVIDTFIEDDIEAKNPGVAYLGKSIEKMADADLFVGCNNLYMHDTKYPGCSIELDVARSYGIPDILLELRFVCPDIWDEVEKALYEVRQ